MEVFVVRIWVLLLLFVSLPVAAVQDVTDVLPSGAHIRVAVPDGWQAGDTLLLYQHGFDMDADANPDLGPLRDLQLAQGYAIAASGYSQSGWALFNAVQDNRDLVAYVSQRFGAPGALVTMGGSMGGLIALKLAESKGFETTAGVYSLCPPAAGARTWDAAFDLRLAYDAECEGVGGGELLKGDEPLSWAINLDDIPESMGDLSGSPSVQQSYARIHQCTGVAFPTWLRTPPQQERLLRLMQFGAFTSEDFLLLNLAYSTFAMSELVRAPDKLGGGNPFTSVDVNYGEALIDARVPRFAADPLAAFDLARASTLVGRIGTNTRIVSLHTDGDELVRLSHQATVRGLYGNKALSMPIDEAVGSHCGFSSAELVAGWQQLRARIADPQSSWSHPQLVGDCNAAITSGWSGPCRFAPDLATGDLATTMRERDAYLAQIADPAFTNISGSWSDPARSGEGVLIERIDSRRASVLWFTYAPAGEAAGLVWLGGVGDITPEGIHVADVRRMYGARFGSAFDPAEVVREPWGSFDLALDRRDNDAHGIPRLHLRYRGPEGFGSGVRTLGRLLSAGYSWPSDISLDPEPLPRTWQYSGTWYDPARSGEGWLLQQTDYPLAQLTGVVWFTYDDAGNALWLTGAAVEADGVLSVALYRTSGTRFGDAFDAAAVQRTRFGTLRFTFEGCDRAAVAFTPADPAGVALDLELVRMTRPDVVSAACSPP